MGAHGYIECSARTGEGVDAMMEVAGREAMRRALVRTNVTPEIFTMNEAELPAKKKKRRLF
jgi:hypothetical protein